MFPPNVARNPLPPPGYGGDRITHTRTDMKTQHQKAFTVAVVWTLGLLFLGSIVHATESSLACPDWPTCYGTMVPVMTGGVFWEHLHRLVAGGLLLMWSLATWIAHREFPDRRWVVKTCWAGLGLLLVQSVFGGMTVLFKLPDLVSTSHLGLALLFLGLATVLASATAWSAGVDAMSRSQAAGVRLWGLFAALLVFAQSVLGGLVRHTDAGMACPDAPLCLGQVVPPLGSGLVALHFFHRVLGITAAIAVFWLALRVHRSGAPAGVRTWTSWATALILIQVGLGFVSVLSGLAVVPVSLHTLVAAGTLAVLVHVTTLGWVAIDGAPAEG
ncbi:MAG TPA: COX15/CtaA family protein [Longimicrobiales bacterium]|nr:COX15/CtaA family protein [Longimicrobiales bacterium]